MLPNIDFSLLAQEQQCDLSLCFCALGNVSLFQGAFANRIPKAQVPDSPAKVSPAPKKPGMTKNHGLTNAPSKTPVNTPQPTMS
jgi:hypothetical protein